MERWQKNNIIRLNDSRIKRNKKTNHIVLFVLTGVYVVDQVCSYPILFKVTLHVVNL